LINHYVLGGKRQLFEAMRIQFGAEPGATNVPYWAQRDPFQPRPPEMEASEQQRLYKETLAKHQETVKWIYETGMLLQCDFSADDEYLKWRKTEDELQDRLSKLSAFPGYEVLGKR
jgi:hypothetical protein